MSEDDKKRHDKEMEQFNKQGYFLNSDGIKSTFLNKKGIAQEFEIGTIMPKKVSVAFMHFANVNRPNLMKENPGKKVGEIAKLLGEAWNKMTADEKKKYEDLQKKD